MNSRRTPSTASGSVRNSPNLHRQPPSSQAARQRPPSTLGVVPAPTPPILEPSPATQGLERPGISSASRYSSNLKVLRRRDPSIISIFDQFSHVCVYHHNGDKWEKQGFEGSMFLYERDSYPPYGFYILNRVGMDDYSQRLYPEDNISIHGSYLMMRSYPKWTARRLESALQASQREAKPVPDKFSPAWYIPNVEDLKEADKAPGLTVGLWIFAGESTESMQDVVVRLHSYIKKNLPYPEQFKYGPDRPPPNSLPVPRTPSVPPSNQNGAQAQVTDRATPSAKSATPTHAILNGLLNHSAPGGTSELDKLFARLNPPLSAGSIQGPASTLTVDSLFASINGKTPPPAEPTSGTTTTGLALLNSIFASAGSASNQQSPTVITSSQPVAVIQSPLSAKGPHPNSRATHNPANFEPESIIIYSPTPTTSALPQILNQDVISTLLGLPPSRASSAAPSSSARTSDSSSTRRSGREGGDEDDGDSSDGGYSESSTVLERLPIGADIVQGDVTPRVPANGHGFDRPPSSTRLQTFVYPGRKPLSAVAPAAVSSLPASVSAPVTNGSRPTATFLTSGEVWDNNTGTDRFDIENGDDDDVVELDFADTRALSDMDAFKRAKAQHAIKAASLVNGRAPNPPHSRDGSDDIYGQSPAASMKDKKNRRKIGKDKVVEVERAVEVAVSPGSLAEALPNSLQRQPHLRAMAALSSPSPIAALPPSALTDPAIINVSSILKVVQQPKSPLQPIRANPVTVNGRVKSDGVNPRVDHDLARQSVTTTTAARLDKQVKLERNDFVREVLTLIHTDKSFVDNLYQDYMSRIV